MQSNVMTEYAAKDICQKLYKLSGWTTDWGYDTSYADNWLRNVSEFPPESREAKWINMIPAYTLAFILDKLPSGAGVIKNSSYPKQTYTARRPHMYGAPENSDPLHGRIGWDADTAANAVCIMACELFDKGVLTSTKEKE